MVFSHILIFLNLIIFILLLKDGQYVFLSIKRARIINSTEKLFIYFALVLILSVFGGLDWDYYSYRNLIKDFHKYHEIKHMEPMYFDIAKYIGNYTAWRAIVWGTATILMVQALRSYNALNVYTCFFLTIFYLLSFYKLRGSLGTSLFFLGLAFVICTNKNQRTFHTIGGIIIIIASLLFHKTMIVSLIILIVIKILPLSKTSLKISLIIFPFALIVITKFIIYFLSNQFSSDNMEIQLAINGGISYTSRGANDTSIIGKISNIISYAPLYIGLFISFKKLYSHSISVPNYIKILLWFWYTVTYIASLFIFIDVSNWLYIRILTMAYFPMCIVLGYVYLKYKYSLLMKFTLGLGTFSYIFSILYTFKNNI